MVDLDRRRVLFFGESLMLDMNERRALMGALATVWTDYEICWAYDGTEELAGYVGTKLRPDPWDRQPNLKLARGRNHLCHLISVVDADGQLRFWPLWWHFSKAWHGPALLDKLPGRGIRRINLGTIPEGGAHIDVRRKTLGAWRSGRTASRSTSNGVTVRSAFPKWTWTWSRASAARKPGSTSGCSRASRTARLGTLPNSPGCWRPSHPASWSAPMPCTTAGFAQPRLSGPASSAHAIWCDPSMPNPRSRLGRRYHSTGRKVPMALNIKDDSVHEAVKRITSITGESQAQAVATAVRERLARLERDELAARLLAIGRKSAGRMSPEAKALDHGALLYDDRGLPA
ncbi:MAG: hypothetical protein QOF88_2419 [Mycobacterium sp.]|nr:hypothetical protein [Mycobacterium sp.]